MRKRPTRPRIPPLRPEEHDEQTEELLGQASVPGIEPLHIFSTLVRHPGLFRKWLPFGGKLMAGKIPLRDRELLILRTGWNCGSEYEWGQHIAFGRDAGLTDDEIERIKAGPDADGWDPFDAALLRAADELNRQHCISDATWEVIAARYDDRQMVEVPMLVGHYHLVAFTLNSLGVQREPGVPSFDDPGS